MAKRWTDLEIEHVRKHYKSGYSVDKLAEELGRSRTSVFKKASDLKMDRFFNSSKTADRILSILNRPMTTMEIAKAIGKTRQSTYHSLRLARARGLCHIQSLGGPSGPSGGHTGFTWVKGDGLIGPVVKVGRDSIYKKLSKADTPKPKKKETLWGAPVIKRGKVRRDPFDECFFGKHGA